MFEKMTDTELRSFIDACHDAHYNGDRTAYDSYYDAAVREWNSRCLKAQPIK